VDREGLDYACGDCTLLVRDRIDARPYSFSSHPDEPVLRFLVRQVGAGPRSFSRWLSSLVPGDEVGVGTPFGAFRPGLSPREVWFATGTGVSPFLAALRARKPVRPLAFCIGLRNPDDAVLGPWVDERARASWAFSRPPAGPGRRVTADAEAVPIAPDIAYYLCGNQKMIRDVAAVLKDRGALASQVHEELFFS
jgi:ferredoxin-NADP reductase